MTLSLRPLVAIAGALALSGSVSAPALAPSLPVAAAVLPVTQSAMPGQALRPLLRLIAKHESGKHGLNAANRGRAGDTPGGSVQAVGQQLIHLTVAEVMAHQRAGRLYAVGAYQLIPRTLAWAVAEIGLDTSRKFDQHAQEELMVALLRRKRPEVWDFLTANGCLDQALLAMAKEWASIGVPFAAGRASRRGISYYAGTGNNRASISPDAVASALQEARAGKLLRKFS